MKRFNKSNRLDSWSRKISQSKWSKNYYGNIPIPVYLCVFVSENDIEMIGIMIGTGKWGTSYQYLNSIQTLIPRLKFGTA